MMLRVIPHFVYIFMKFLKFYQIKMLIKDCEQNIINETYTHSHTHTQTIKAQSEQKMRCLESIAIFDSSHHKNTKLQINIIFFLTFNKC